MESVPTSNASNLPVSCKWRALSDEQEEKYVTANSGGGFNKYAPCPTPYTNSMVAIARSSSIISRDSSILAPCRVYTEKDLSDPVYIARGGFGEVIKYKHRLMTSEVVVKKASNLSHEEQQKEESYLHFALQHHPNIVQVYGFLHYSDNTRGIMMEYLNEGNLNTVINEVIVGNEKRQFIYDLSHVIKWTMDITSAIQFIHKRLQIVHLDLKPGNILLCNDRTATKVTDFGLSFSMHEGKKRKGGTASYMAPEVWKQGACLKSDIYSIGIILWQLLHRRATWPADYTIYKIYTAVSNGERPEIASDCLADLTQIMHNCWSTVIAERCDAETLFVKLGSFSSAHPMCQTVSRISDTELLINNSLLSTPKGTRVTSASRPAPLPVPSCDLMNSSTQEQNEHPMCKTVSSMKVTDPLINNAPLSVPKGTRASRSTSLPVLSCDVATTQKEEEKSSSIAAIDDLDHRDSAPSVRGYYGQLPREAAQLFLAQEPDGSFLIRDSETFPGQLVLSLKYHDTITHHVIDKKSNFKDLAQLTTHYESEEGLCTKVQKPIVVDVRQTTVVKQTPPKKNTVRKTPPKRATNPSNAAKAFALLNLVASSIRLSQI